MEKFFQAFVHVSTAFANCYRKDIDEKLYKTAISGENGIKVTECLDDQTLDAITSTVIKGWPNTYTFTKCLAEDLIRTTGKGLPIVVFRPAIGKEIFILQKQLNQFFFFFTYFSNSNIS